jgi:DNA-binding MarR family transcriptional regulator
MADRTECIQALEEVMRRIGRQYRQRLGADTITLGQFAILRSLAQEGPMAMGEVAHNLGVSLAGATGLIDRLVHADMVKRYRSDADRRVVWVDLSDRGSREYERLQEEREKYFERLFSSLDDDRVAQLLDILKVIDEGLEKDHDDLPAADPSRP